MSNNLQFRITSYLQLARLCDETESEDKKRYKELAENLLNKYEEEILAKSSTNSESVLDDDYRIGLIEEYVKGMNEVCCIEIWEQCLFYGTQSKPVMRRRNSNEIVDILVNHLGFVRGGAQRFGCYGMQKAYLRP